MTNVFKQQIIDLETKNMSGINSFDKGYICEDDDIIVGLQTDAPLKRIVKCISMCY